MNFPAEVYASISKYLDESDMLSLSLTNKAVSLKIKSFYFRLNINSSNVKRLSQKTKGRIHFNEIAIRGHFEDPSLLAAVFSLLTCTNLDLDSSIVYNSKFKFPYGFTETVNHLTVVDDALEHLNLPHFTNLNIVTLKRIRKGNYVSVKNYSNIFKLRFVDCDFQIRSESEDYVFGDKRVLTVMAEKFGMSNITELVYERSKATYSSIVFELYTLTAVLFPKIKKYTMRNCSLSSLAPFKDCTHLEYLRIENDFAKLVGVDFGKNLKHLHIIADKIHIDKCISNLRLKSLKIICQKLLSETVIPAMPDCENIEIITRNGKISKSCQTWYYYNKITWIRVDESDALKAINPK
eukprot:NODE_122_length_18870_cov_0.236908.p4 type:complete len:351 gc:universal NODE_122_length_18870_cov_0.236908:341-1393(+)